MKPKVLVVAGAGLNCENETAVAFKICGAESEIRFFTEIFDRPEILRDFQILVFPGGFSFGDRLGAGRAAAETLRGKIFNELKKFAVAEKLILGICNGFQILANLGVFDGFEQKFALLPNSPKPRYVCRWVDLKVESKKCVFFRGVGNLKLPIAHGEGRFFADENFLENLKTADRVAVKYLNENPNGSAESIAGVCDFTGRICGMMPHPERNFFFHHRPDFFEKKVEFENRGEKVPEFSDGKRIFENAVSFFG
jgi:phosphoribosylformylglycinamidine synthase